MERTRGGWRASELVARGGAWSRILQPVRGALGVDGVDSTPGRRSSATHRRVVPEGTSLRGGRSGSRDRRQSRGRNRRPGPCPGPKRHVRSHFPQSHGTRGPGHGEEGRRGSHRPTTVPARLRTVLSHSTPEDTVRPCRGRRPGSRPSPDSRRCSGSEGPTACRGGPTLPCLRNHPGSSAALHRGLGTVPESGTAPRWAETRNSSAVETAPVRHLVGPALPVLRHCLFSRPLRALNRFSQSEYVNR